MTDDIKAIRDALAAGPSTGGGHIYTHPRDDNRHAENFAWHQACSPERIARLLDALELAQKDAALIRAQALDEAARVIEPGPGTEPNDIREDGYEMLRELAAAVRALKDKP